jgi:tRNA A-37 threonylcarbamoyl transferase component Bud32
MNADPQLSWSVLILFPIVVLTAVGLFFGGVALLARAVRRGIPFPARPWVMGLTSGLIMLVAMGVGFALNEGGGSKSLSTSIVTGGVMAGAVVAAALSRWAYPQWGQGWTGSTDSRGQLLSAFSTHHGVSIRDALVSKEGAVIVLIAVGVVVVGAVFGWAVEGSAVGLVLGVMLLAMHTQQLRRRAILKEELRRELAAERGERPLDAKITPSRPTQGVWSQWPGGNFRWLWALLPVAVGAVVVNALIGTAKGGVTSWRWLAVLIPLTGGVIVMLYSWSKRKSKATPAAGQFHVAPLLLTPDPTQLRGDCPTCLYPIPADSPHGLCPRCLIRGAMPSPTSTRLRPVGRIEPPTPAEVDEFFPHLEVLELIGAGGMGAVYTARQPALDRVVALKIVQSPRGDDDPVFAERFAREARAMAKLDHPNIVTIHESGEAGGLPFLLMEYVDGVTLREAMVNRLLTTTEALAVIPQVCDALDFAHRHGVVHRDIKPENILIDQTGRVKIADFGLAKLADPKNVTLTRTQQAMGTPHYMAPEQWERPNDVDHRADVYALGVVLYELLTGELPLGRFALPSEMGKGDVRLDQVVIRAMAKDPNERYQNAGQMKAALSGVKLAAFTPAVPRKRKGFEYKSRARFMGMPLVHVVGGRDAITGRKRIAKGWIAVGDLMAVGGIAVGGVTGIGLIGIGGVCGVGLLGLGGACGFGAVGVGGNAGGFLASLGGTSASNGVAVGGLAAGKFAIGGLAGGEYVISEGEMTPGFGEALVVWIRGFWPW